MTTPSDNIDPTGASFLSALESFGEQLLQGFYVLSSTAYECAVGAGAAEEASEMAQPAIALVPGLDAVAETAIPLAGCFIGAASATKYDYNLLG